MSVLIITKIKGSVISRDQICKNFTISNENFYLGLASKSNLYFRIFIKWKFWYLIFNTLKFGNTASITSWNENFQAGFLKFNLKKVT